MLEEQAIHSLGSLSCHTVFLFNPRAYTKVLDLIELESAKTKTRRLMNMREMCSLLYSLLRVQKLSSWTLISVISEDGEAPGSL
jgi:hypothetical protein